MSQPPEDSLHLLSARLRDFARERDWEQFHSPKNLSMALIAEAAELVEHFQWLSEAQSYQLADHKRDAVALELADKLEDLAAMAGAGPAEEPLEGVGASDRATEPMRECG